MICPHYATIAYFGHATKDLSGYSLEKVYGYAIIPLKKCLGMHLFVGKSVMTCLFLMKKTNAICI